MLIPELISMMNTPTQKTHQADVLLRCSKPEHANCAVMRDALVETFKNVTSAYTTRTDMEGTDYCVSASAIVKDGEIMTFRKKLKHFKGKSPKTFKVSKVKLQVIRH